MMVLTELGYMIQRVASYLTSDNDELEDAEIIAVYTTVKNQDDWRYPVLGRQASKVTRIARPAL